MGWVITLESNKEVTRKVVDEVIKKLPDWIRYPAHGGGKQVWGWSLVVDVMLSSELGPKFVRLSGSYTISGSIAQEVAEEFKQAFEELGHEIEIDSRNF